MRGRADVRAAASVAARYAFEAMATRRILPLAAAFVAAVALVAVPETAFARGGGGHGGGGGHAGGGGHFGGGWHGGGGYHGYGGAYLGRRGGWWGSPYWGRGFWGWRGTGWVWMAGPWYVSPIYPGWVWVEQQWVWDGEQWGWQEGYWAPAG